MAQGPDRPAASTADFAALLREARRAAGLTQQELAVRAGVGVRTVRELERGRATRPQRSTVELLCDALALAGPARSRFVAAARGRTDADLAPGPAGGVGLPPPLSLVGRDDALHDVAELFAVADVVTLVGLAGVGKTGLAVSVAHRVTGRFPAGVGGVSVSDVSAEADVLATVAAVFGTGRADELAERYAGRDALLLLDGVDRAAAAATAAAGWLRAQVPTMRILVTSRHPIEVPGAVEYPVTPLEVPPADATDLETVAEYPAAALFLDRLRQVRRHPVHPAEAPVLAELVRRLGGLPLALELAAARGRVLELPEILERYGNRVLDLGTVGQAPGQTQTLRDAIDASYRLLDPAAQAALCRLSALGARWSVELAEALLCPPGLDGEHCHADVEALLDRLVGLGLVSVRAGGDLRFRLLDVVRDFAVEQCAKAGELAAARDRHAEVFAALVERANAEMVGATLPAAVYRIDHLASDIRAALAHATAHRPHVALRLAVALTRWWRFRGRDREGRDQLRRLLADPGTADVDPAVRAAAQVGVAMLAAEHGDAGAELPTARAALDTFVRLGDAAGELSARSCLCVLWQAVGGYDEARRHAEAIRDVAGRTGRVRELAVAENNLTWHEIRVGDLGVAARRLSRAARLATQADDPRLQALVQANIAEVARLDGRYAAAVGTGRRALSLLADVGDPGHRVRVLATVGKALAQAGRLAEAAAVLSELPDSGPVAAGARALVSGYLALARGERPAAVKPFEVAAEVLAGQHDARDVVEALVGLAAALDDPAQRAAVLAQLARVRGRGGFTLLPRERALLASG